jgi:hypothetical protein
MDPPNKYKIPAINKKTKRMEWKGRELDGIVQAFWGL